MIHLTEPALVLAPMDGVTDYLMRGILTRRLPFTYCVSEFVRVSAHVPPAKVFRADIPELCTSSCTASGVPVGVQILGGDAERMAGAAALAAELGAHVVDINFGCPAPTVNRHDGGATLLKFPDRIEEIVRAVRGAVPDTVPVSVKLRLGWDNPCVIEENAERAAQGGASWITIHGRTKMQGYTPPAYWRPIGAVRAALKIPVVANGEIWSLDDLRRCQDETGCIHFMVGRGALARPPMVAECAAHLGIRHRTVASIPDGDSGWRELMEELVLESRTAGEADRRTLSRVKQWLNYAHHRGAIAWFDQVKRVRDTRELAMVLARLKLVEHSLPFAPIEHVSDRCVEWNPCSV